MVEIALLLGCFALLVYVEHRDYRRAPYCRWCDWRHHGRCVFMKGRR